jgi:hypothetical protein
LESHGGPKTPEVSRFCRLFGQIFESDDRPCEAAMYPSNLLVFTLFGVILGQQLCDDRTKSQLEELQNAQVASFDKCDPGKKIWDALTDFKAPDFKACVCSEDLHQNMLE